MRGARGLAVAWVGLLLAALASPVAGQAPAEPIGSISVSVRGVEGPVRDNVLAHLGVAELAERGGLLTRLDPRNTAREITLAELQRRHAAAPAEIRDALIPYGYYLPEIRPELIETRAGYEARYTIDPGPPARIRNVDIRVEGAGAERQAIRRAVQAVEIREGQRLVHSRYEAARESIFDAAYDEGYLRARWLTREIRVSSDRRAADIRLVLETGSRFYFGEVEIHADRLNPEFTARYTDIRPGDPYDVRRLLDLQLLLNETEYFASVEIRADPADADAENRIPVVVRTQPSRPQRYTVGVGYATDTGPRFNFGMQLRRVNANGHRFRSELLVSTIETAVAGRYAIPIRNVASDLLDFSATARELEVGDAESRQYALGASQYVGWRGFRRRVYLQLQREEFQFGDDPTQATKLLYPGVTLTRDTGDDMLYPRRGYSLQLDLRGGGEALLSDVSLLRFKADMRWVRALGDRARLLVRAEAGALKTSRFDRLPPTQRFFAGGDRSVRGYEYQMIGERNPAGDVIGGRYIVVGSIEAERLLFGDFGLAAFVDAGDAFVGSFDAKVGAGAGIRWRSPVGMVRLDLAHPFHADDSVRFHLSIGADL